MVISYCWKRYILSRSNFFKIPKRNGYIVLVPEIGDDLLQGNLIKDDKTPEFNNLTIEKCIASIGKQTLEFEEGIKNIETSLQKNKNADVFNDVLQPIEEMYTPLETTWGIARTLYYGYQSLMPTKCYLSIHQRANKASAFKYSNISIYQACKNTLETKVNLTDQQKRILQKYILEGKLNGLELTGKQFEGFKYCLYNLEKHMQDFTQKLEESTNKFNHVIKDFNVIKNLPEDLLKLLAPDSTKPYTGPWTVTLQPYVLKMFLEHCPDRVLRYKLWIANVTRSSVLNDKLQQTSSTLENIRHHRKEQAKFLGYPSYIEMSLETKMVDSLETLYNTFDILQKVARPAQVHEIKTLTEFANERGMEGAIKPWDIPYWSQKQCYTVYKYQDDVLKNYFPLSKVLSGLFELIETLFSVKVTETRKVDTWHKDVCFFDIFDLRRSNMEPIASFYLDPYSRKDEKMRLTQNSAFMIPIRNKSGICNTIPMIALIFNFQRPMETKPSLLTFKDIQILFQKFGHALRYMLTTVEYADISGVSFVEWDAAYVTDFFLENWLYEPGVLQSISEHYDTKEPLPLEMIEIIKNARRHLAGYNLCEKLFYSHLDLELHASDEFWIPIMRRLWKKYFVIPVEKKDLRVCSFATIFSNNFAAAYYSYLWSEMLAADIHSAFQEVPPEDENRRKEICNRFRETFLTLGGTYPASETFRRFRGRDPSSKAFLKNLNLQWTVME